MSEKLCPITADPCMQHSCEFFLPVTGKNPNTGEPLREFECVHKLTPIFLMGTIQAVTKLDAEVSAARSETRQQSQQLSELLSILIERIYAADTKRGQPQVHLPGSEDVRCAE